VSFRAGNIARPALGGGREIRTRADDGVAAPTASTRPAKVVAAHGTEPSPATKPVNEAR
jgi:hypothetical protein